MFRDLVRILQHTAAPKATRWLQAQVPQVTSSAVPTEGAGHDSSAGVSKAARPLNLSLLAQQLLAGLT